MVPKKLAWRPQLLVRGAGFAIRQYQSTDQENLVKYFGHPQVRRNVIGQPKPYFPADAKKFLTEKLRQYKRRKVSKHPGESESLGYAIDIGGELVGGVGVTIHGHSADIGYWLAKPRWGQGIMTEVVRAWIRYLTKKFKLRTIEARVFPFNQASMRVLHKNGFHFQVRLVNSYRIGNKYLDDVVFVKKGRK